MTDPASADVFNQPRVGEMTEGTSPASTYASALLESVIDPSSGLIKSIGGLDAPALSEVLEGLRVIGAIASLSVPIADQFASDMFDHELFLIDLIRGLRAEPRLSSAPVTDLPGHLLLLSRLIDSLTGVVESMSSTPKTFIRARTRLERQVAETAAEHWDEFAGPVCRFLLAVDRFRNDAERPIAAWTGHVSIVEILKKSAKLTHQKIVSRELY